MTDDKHHVFTITHPFYPIVGQEFVLSTRRLNWGEDRVMYYNHAGKLCSLPTSWTSEKDEDVFIEVSAGCCWFRIDDLQELANLLATLKKQRRSRQQGVK